MNAVMLVACVDNILVNMVFKETGHASNKSV